MPSFSFFKIAATTAALVASALVYAPQAIADENGSFDMTSFAQPVEPEPASEAANFGANNSFNNGYIAGTGAPTQQAPRQNYLPSPSRPTPNLRNANIAYATRAILSQNGNQKLPVTNLDSFVYQSGMSEAIYGDEGTDGIPPMMGFSEGNTIGSGINNGGLTTGHQSNMPSAWCSYR